MISIDNIDVYFTAVVKTESKLKTKSKSPTKKVKTFKKETQLPDFVSTEIEENPDPIEEPVTEEPPPEEEQAEVKREESKKEKVITGMNICRLTDSFCG